MGNERNVEALLEALRRCRGFVRVTAGRDRIESDLELLARDLIDQGVLVPAALTDAEARSIREDESGVREALARLARGD